MFRIKAGGGGSLHEGGRNCLKYLKSAEIEKRGVGTKIQKGGQGRLRIGALKQRWCWEGWNPSKNYGEIV